MNEYFDKTYTIRSTEVDRYGVCRPSAILSFCQDVSAAHVQALNIDQAYLTREYHAVWLLVRTWYRLSRPLRMGEEVTFRTWQRGAGGLSIYRDFDLFSGGGWVGEAVNVWVVVDKKTRKFLRPGSVEHIDAAPVPDRVKERELKLIHTPKDKRLIHQREIRYSDLDINGHMNNTKYADVVLDALRVEELQGRFVSELQINYSRECLPGEQLDIFRRMGEHSCYVDGCDSNGARRFEAIMEFREPPLDGAEVLE